MNVILELNDPPEKWQALGHEFRVFARIRQWHSPDVLRVPLSALFRHGEQWSTFKVVDGLARLQRVEIGQRNGSHAEVVSGLEPDDEVILYPSDRVEDGVRVARRD